MDVTLGPTDEVSDVEISRSVPLPDETAVAAVEHWRYEPAPADGVPVSVLLTVTVNFRLPSS